MTSPVPSFAEGRAAWVADLDRVAARDHWGLALILIGCLHLGVFLGCEVMHASGDRTGWHYIVVWGLELGAMLGILRIVAGRGWFRASPLAGVIARVWGTVLILSFNLASLNSLMGLDHEWFKPVLCTVAAFGFMMMAYLVSSWFFAAAVHMYFTGLIMVHFLDMAYVIHGVSWWALLMVIGTSLHRRRRILNMRPIVVDVRATPAPGTFHGRRLQFRVERPY